MDKLFPERLKTLEPFWGVWRLNASIGEGSYGKVFKIVRTDLGSEYTTALKWIYLPHQDSEIDSMRSEGMSDEEIRSYYDSLIKTLTNEIRMMSELGGNSHIVNYLDHIVIPRRGEIGWDILIRMEYLTPLDKYMRDHDFSERDAVTVGWHICQALTLCAKHKILHRDIKPDNIFRSADGNYKLGDFGVSRTLEGTRSNLSIKGTPLYMSPEVLTNRKATFSADVYSLGLVLYRILNHQRMPFLPLYDLPTHDNREKALERRIRGDVLPEPADGCRELKRIVLKACAYEPDNRYASAEEMGAMLEQLLKKGKLSDAPLFPERFISQMNSGRSSLHPDVRSFKTAQSEPTDDGKPSVDVQKPYEAARSYDMFKSRDEKSTVENVKEPVAAAKKENIDLTVGLDMNAPDSGAEDDDAEDVVIEEFETKPENPKRVLIGKKRAAKGKSPLIILLVVAAALVCGGVYLLFGRPQTPSAAKTAVQTSAKTPVTPSAKPANAAVSKSKSTGDISKVVGNWEMNHDSVTFSISLQSNGGARLVIRMSRQEQVFEGSFTFDGFNIHLDVGSRTIDGVFYENVDSITLTIDDVAVIFQRV